MSERFPDLPDQMKRLPVDKRGFPIPKFVHWADGEPVFPIAEQKWLVKAHRQDICYVCGGRLGRHRVSVIGPMCAVNRTISEPPSHTACARFSAIHCPFLANPRMKRVPEEKLLAKAPHGGHTEESILRNPGAVCVWIAAEKSRPFKTPAGNWVFNLPEASAVEWYANGREATREEVLQSIDSGMPLLMAECDRENTETRRKEARQLLGTYYQRTLALLPAEQVQA